MINKKIIAVFALLFCFALYDNLVKKSVGFPVNLVVFFYVSLYSFIVYVIYIFYQETINKFDKKVLIVGASPFLLRICLNLLSINRDRDIYNNLVSNEYIDYFSWLALIVILITISWRKFIV